jgi:hypothetical protein
MKLCDYPLKKKTPDAARATPGEPQTVPVPKVKEQSHRKTKFRAKKLRPVKICWMENRELTVGEYHCEGCKEFFYFLSYRNTDDKPHFCPLCGKPRKK